MPSDRGEMSKLKGDRGSLRGDDEQTRVADGELAST
jgi:hypothetical protein